LIGSEVGAHKEKFRGRGWAIAGLIGVAALYALRYTERDNAIQIATQNGPAAETRVFANPHPGNPFLWSMVTDTPESYVLSNVDSRRGIVLLGSETLYKPPISLPMLAAKRTYLGRVYLDWSMFPVMSQAPDNSDPNHPLVQVRFADARFMYDSLLSNGRNAPALTGTVTLDMAAPEGDRVVEMEMNGKVQK
jgi:inner membrane protein